MIAIKVSRNDYCIDQNFIERHMVDIKMTQKITSF